MIEQESSKLFKHLILIDQNVIMTKISPRVFLKYFLEPHVQVEKLMGIRLVGIRLLAAEIGKSFIGHGNDADVLGKLNAILPDDKNLLRN
jgi:hypothetical protein